MGIFIDTNTILGFQIPKSEIIHIEYINQYCDCSNNNRNNNYCQNCGSSNNIKKKLIHNKLTNLGIKYSKICGCNEYENDEMCIHKDVYYYIPIYKISVDNYDSNYNDKIIDIKKLNDNKSKIEKLLEKNHIIYEFGLFSKLTINP